MYIFFHIVDWVVGNYSTVLIEAQMFDVKVAILKFDFYKVVSFLYQNGYAILVDSPEQLIKEIENIEILFDIFPHLYSVLLY